MLRSGWTENKELLINESRHGATVSRTSNKNLVGIMSSGLDNGVICAIVSVDSWIVISLKTHRAAEDN